MHPYIEQTSYAVKGLLNLRLEDQNRNVGLQAKREEAETEVRKYMGWKYAGVTESGFGEDITNYTELKILEYKKKVRDLNSEIRDLGDLIRVKEISMI